MSRAELPEKIEAAFRLFTENAQHQHTHGCLVGPPCKEAERVRAAIREALDEARWCRDCVCECHKEDL